MSWNVKVVMGLTLAASIGVGQSHAGGLYLNEFATPSMGTAGAGGEAWAHDASTAFAFHNPAGMTRLEGHQLSLGFGLGRGETEFDANANTPFGGGNGGDAAGLVPLLGSHGVLSLTEDLKLGFSVFSVSGAALDYNNAWAGRFQVQEFNLLTVTANPTLAYQVTDWLSLAGGVLVVFSIITLDKMKIDDPVGAISVHGVVGLLGLLLVPVTNGENSSFSGQLIGAATIFIWVFVVSGITWAILKAVMGIRVSEEDEYDGVDLSECGMEAYPEFITAK